MESTVCSKRDYAIYDLYKGFINQDRKGKFFMTMTVRGRYVLQHHHSFVIYLLQCNSLLWVFVVTLLTLPLITFYSALRTPPYTSQTFLLLNPSGVQWLCSL